MTPPPPPFSFRAHYNDLWDGDTLYLDIDRGEGLWSVRAKYRLYGVDTPEVSRCTDEEKIYGLEAKEYVNSLLGAAHEFIVSTHKGKSKYDWLIEIWLVGSASYVYLSDHLIETGHAVPYNGGKKLPWPERKAIQDNARAVVK